MHEYKIGVFGSAVDANRNTEQAKMLGKELGKQNVTVITGAGHGLPYIVASEAAKNGAKIWGYPPTTSLEELQKYMPDTDTSIYNKLVYIPQDYPYRSNIAACRQYRIVSATTESDAGIIIAGRWGSMSEFASLRETGKVCGVLTNTGGLADELEELEKKLQKQSAAKVFYDNSPEHLIQLVLNDLEFTRLTTKST